MHRIFLALLLGFSCSLSARADEYPTAQDAVAAGGKYLRERNYALAQPALEAALKLTPDDDSSTRCDIYCMLIIAYRTLPKVDKMQEAVEFVLNNEDSQVTRMLVGGDFVQFLQKGGHEDWAVSHYEDVLKSEPRDPTSLIVLSRIYSLRRNDPRQQARGKQLQEELKTLNHDLAVRKAERLEAAAVVEGTKPATAWKNVAKAWLDADDAKRAKIAIEKSIGSPPEARSPYLATSWREGVGDVLAELGEVDRAIAEYETALALTDLPSKKSSLQKKIEKLKAGKN